MRVLDHPKEHSILNTLEVENIQWNNQVCFGRGSV